MAIQQKYRREEVSEVSCCLKYIIFSFNVLFWMFGLSVMAVGVWAWTEKNAFNNLSKLTHIALDPAFALILIGGITFIIGFTGCIGALRENTCLLGSYAVLLAVILVLELTAGVLTFVFKDSIKSQATEGLQTFIVHYREDPDQQNLIDWIQEDWLQCCGIKGPEDWDLNNYFNCSSQKVGSREACGVPFSCCKRKLNEIVENKQCGYDVRKEGFYAEKWTSLNLPTQTGERNIYERGCMRAAEEWVEDNFIGVLTTVMTVTILQTDDVGKRVDLIINEKGCLQSGEEWLERNMLFIATVCLISAFCKILGICFAQNLRADIFAQKGKWH
ncbi:PREDICTED: tetraspanin-5 isoform X1 [Diuraphis noxia]|uniref:tetraspanin-5 isoform X1 n=1 Tax=Diuraphis noxia TaxID=143948 RepID=UPI0007638D5D|nr:PREDICTED: tetraspanin-5 isoform X1 [Diuraphis noxia]XP_015367981.1 PREDICTED: tetraspanin-5 isoform X1 [Diuraphis noxia]